VEDIEPMICISLMPETTDATLAGLADAARWGAWAELRLDAMREFDLKRILTGSPCPVIVTYRPRREGGLYDGPEGPRLETLRQAARLGARFIDVEHDAIAALGDVPPAKVIVSYHNFKETPASLAEIHARLAATGAAVVKVATMANHIMDAVAVLRLLADARRPTIALAMGPRGNITRILAHKFGGVLTFAAPETPGQKEAAPGQVSVATLKNLYRADRLGPATRMYGVIADPVGHSLSPAIHNAAFAELGLDAVYLPLWVEGDPAPFIRAMRGLGADGYSVTVPHKLAVMPALDEIEPLARRIGAVNTIQRRSDDTLWGTNTDWTAGLAAIEAIVGTGWLAGKRAIILGGGGVGRAMAFALAQRQTAVTLTDIDAPRAAALAREVGGQSIPMADVPQSAPDILLNCSPIGMHPKSDASPVPPTMLRPDMVVYDAVYNPLQTRLVREAAAAGCRTVSGIDHFVRQAVEQFELWTGRPAPVQTMRQVVLDALKK
jgi:3-dehydroquinate dehydratase / shikimate dehydrogenase